MKHMKMSIVAVMLLAVSTVTYAAKTYEPICSGHEKVCDNGKCGLFENGHAGPLQYDNLKCSGNLILVSSKGKWGIYNESTEKAGPIVYDSIEDFGQGLAKVSRNGAFGLVRAQDSGEVLPVKNGQTFSRLQGMDGYLVFQNNKKSGIIYVNGQDVKVIAPETYDSIEKVPGYYKGYYQVLVKGKKGIIYLPYPFKQEQVALSYITAAFDDIRMPPWYQWVQVSKNGKWAFYDVKESRVVTPFYDNIEKMRSDLYKVSSKRMVGALLRISSTNKLEEVVSPAFTDIKPLMLKNQYAVAKQGKWGVYDSDKKQLVIDCLYEDVRNAGSKAMQVLQNGKWTKIEL